MNQLTQGTVTVTNGSATVTGSGTNFLQATAGESFFVAAGDNVVYTVAGIASNTSLTLSSPFQGTSASGIGYIIHVEIIDGLPLFSPADADTALLMNEVVKRVVEHGGRLDDLEATEAGLRTAAFRDVGTADAELPDNAVLRNQYGLYPEIDIKPTLSLDFAANKYSVYEGLEGGQTEKPYDDILDVTRAGSETGETATGTIGSAGTDKLPLVYRDGVPQGAQITGEVTNLLLWSEDFTQASWSLTQATIESVVDIAPDGISAANKLVYNDGASGGRAVQNFTFVQDTNYTLSCFVKSAGLTRSSIRFFSSETGFIQTEFDLSEVSITFTSSGASSKIEALSNGWFKVSLSFNSGNAASSTQIQLCRNSPIAGDGDAGFLIWGAQLTQSSVPLPYVKTEGTQVTKPATTVVRELGDGWSGRKICLFVEWNNSLVESIASFIPNYSVLTLSNASATQFRGFGLVNGDLGINKSEIVLRLRDGVMSDSLLVGVANVGINKAAFWIDRDNLLMGACLNGAESLSIAITDDIADSFLSHLHFVTAQQLAGANVRRVRVLNYLGVEVMPFIPTDAELIALTTPKE